MAVTKYLDLQGLSYFKSKCDAKYATNADITNAVNTALSAYKQNIVTIVSDLSTVTSPEEGKLYLVPDANASSNDVYTTWAWEDVSGTPQWVQMGSATFTPATVDATIIQNSTNAVQGGAVYTALEGKLDTTSLTAVIASGASNAVTSGAIYDALALKADAADIDSVSNAEVDAMFMPSDEIWLTATNWTAMSVMYDTQSQTAPGLSLVKNSLGYYVFDIGDLTTADTLVFSDGTNSTSQITNTLAGIQAYAGKIITVDANSATVTVVA